MEPEARTKTVIAAPAYVLIERIRNNRLACPWSVARSWFPSDSSELKRVGVNDAGNLAAEYGVVAFGRERAARINQEQ